MQEVHNTLERKGRLLIVSGPSGAGKGTIVSRVMQHSADTIKLSVSATTRKPREGEQDGIHYYFLSQEEFLRRAEKGEFLEYASVHGNYYGTPEPTVQKALREGMDVILEIDVQGAMQIKKNFDDGVYIFILPPSMEELRKRLTQRGTESVQDLEIRMEKALAEIEYLDRYDYAVVNDDLDVAVKEVLSVVEAEHCRIGGDAARIIRRYREES